MPRKLLARLAAGIVAALMAAGAMAGAGAVDEPDVGENAGGTWSFRIDDGDDDRDDDGKGWGPIGFGATWS